ncbi:MAG: flagellar basal body rod protein FlgB [Acidaminococcales bacterium]|nr:flagellar basal body rod protein FlgB [Acidaminococcales bacterium]
MLDFIAGTANIRTLESALRVSSLRQKVLSNNIANVDTPLFKRSEVLFETYLKDYLDYLEKEKKPEPAEKKLAMTATNSRHIVPRKEVLPEPFLGAVVRTVNENVMRTDGNNVDIDSEMADMAKNTIYYQAIAQRIGGYFTTMRTVIENR